MGNIGVTSEKKTEESQKQSKIQNRLGEGPDSFISLEALSVISSSEEIEGIPERCTIFRQNEGEFLMGVKIRRSEYAAQQIFTNERRIKFEDRIQLSHQSLFGCLGSQPQEAQDIQVSVTESFETLIYEYNTLSLESLVGERLDSNRLFPESDLLVLANSTIKVLAFLQLQGIPHGDIHPSSIFFKIKSGVFAVYDRDFLCGRCIGMRLAENGRKFSYLSPEQITLLRSGSSVFTANEMIFKSDIFSLGMTLLEAASLRLSQECYDENYSILAQVIQERLEQVSQYYSPLLSNYLTLMLEFDIHNRLDPISLLNKIQSDMEQQHINNNFIKQEHIQQEIQNRIISQQEQQIPLHFEEGLSSQHIQVMQKNQNLIPAQPLEYIPPLETHQISVGGGHNLPMSNRKQSNAHFGTRLDHESREVSSATLPLETTIKLGSDKQYSEQNEHDGTNYQNIQQSQQQIFNQTQQIKLKQQMQQISESQKNGIQEIPLTQVQQQYGQIPIPQSQQSKHFQIPQSQSASTSVTKQQKQPQSQGNQLYSINRDQNRWPVNEDQLPQTSYQTYQTSIKQSQADQQISEDQNYFQTEQQQQQQQESNNKGRKLSISSNQSNEMNPSKILQTLQEQQEEIVRKLNHNLNVKQQQIQQSEQKEKKQIQMLKAGIPLSTVNPPAPLQQPFLVVSKQTQLRNNTPQRIQIQSGQNLQATAVNQIPQDRQPSPQILKTQQINRQQQQQQLNSQGRPNETITKIFSNNNDYPVHQKAQLNHQLKHSLESIPPNPLQQLPSYPQQDLNHQQQQQQQQQHQQQQQQQQQQFQQQQQQYLIQVPIQQKQAQQLQLVQQGQQFQQGNQYKQIIIQTSNVQNLKENQTAQPQYIINQQQIRQPNITFQQQNQVPVTQYLQQPAFNEYLTTSNNNNNPILLQQNGFIQQPYQIINQNKMIVHTPHKQKHSQQEQAQIQPFQDLSPIQRTYQNREEVHQNPNFNIENSPPSIKIDTEQEQSFYHNSPLEREQQDEQNQLPQQYLLTPVYFEQKLPQYSVNQPLQSPYVMQTEGLIIQESNTQTPMNRRSQFTQQSTPLSNNKGEKIFINQTPFVQQNQMSENKQITSNSKRTVSQIPFYQQSSPASTHKTPLHPNNNSFNYQNPQTNQSESLKLQERQQNLKYQESNQNVQLFQNPSLPSGNKTIVKYGQGLVSQSFDGVAHFNQLNYYQNPSDTYQENQKQLKETQQELNETQKISYQQQGQANLPPFSSSANQNLSERVKSVIARSQAIRKNFE